MAKHPLHNINGHFVESDYENALISFLENEGWQYLFGDTIPRCNKKEVLYMDDLLQFLEKKNPDLDDDEIRQIADNIRLVGADSDFATLHKVYGWMIDGVQFVAKNGKAKMVQLIDFEDPDDNVFRVVNQFTVEYINNGETKNRRPDVLLYINGLPVCVIELKNPADANATVYDAWEQHVSALSGLPMNTSMPGEELKMVIRSRLCLLRNWKRWLRECTVLSDSLKSSVIIFSSGTGNMTRMRSR